jgi:hypothetical protein
MEISLYKNQYPTGSRKSIQFVWEFGKLKIRTYEQHIAVSDGDIYERDDKHFIMPPSLNRQHHPEELEIPVTVIEQMDKLNIHLKNSRESIGHVDHKEGKIFLSLNTDGKILAKQGSKNAVADMEIIENKNAINIEQLGLSVQYIEVPHDVETAYTKAKNIKIMEKCSLTYAGKSLLTGKDYFKFNFKIPVSSWDCIEDFFENFGSGSGRTGELTGWLTSQPEKVEVALGLKTTVGDRKKEIDLHNDGVKKFEDAIATLEK